MELGQQGVNILLGVMAKCPGGGGVGDGRGQAKSPDVLAPPTSSKVRCVSTSKKTVFTPSILS